jgi:SAM-dependent methyltransferase
LLEAYSRIPTAYFEGQEHDDRYTDFYKWIAGKIESCANGRRVLDIGCGEGNFLYVLGKDWEKLGLEPSMNGVLAATRKGLTTILGTITDLGRDKEFDVIVALDVIEHLLEPTEFLHCVRSHLPSLGTLVIVTGDRSSLPARVAGRRWSYIRWGGHVSILSKSALMLLLRRAGFDPVSIIRCSHPASPGPLAWWRVLVLEPVRRILGRSPSWYPFWRDHLLIIARPQSSILVKKI